MNPVVRVMVSPGVTVMVSPVVSFIGASRP